MLDTRYIVSLIIDNDPKYSFYADEFFVWFWRLNLKFLVKFFEFYSFWSFGVLQLSIRGDNSSLWVAEDSNQ